MDKHREKQMSTKRGIKKDGKQRNFNTDGRHSEQDVMLPT
jgi:hypothetical protein